MASRAHSQREELNRNNAVNRTIIVVLFGLSLVLAAQVIAPKLFAAG
jgi:hypothetical protein